MHVDFMPKLPFLCSCNINLHNVITGNSMALFFIKVRALVNSNLGWRTKMAKWIGAACATKAAEHDGSDSDGEQHTARIHATPSQSVPLSVLFGGTVKHSQTVRQLDEEEGLMQALVEQSEDDWLDNGAIKNNSDAYGA
jgi:hypothetical protein